MLRPFTKGGSEAMLFLFILSSYPTDYDLKPRHRGRPEGEGTGTYFQASLTRKSFDEA